MIRIIPRCFQTTYLNIFCIKMTQQVAQHRISYFCLFSSHPCTSCCFPTSSVPDIQHSNEFQGGVPASQRVPTFPTGSNISEKAIHQLKVPLKKKKMQLISRRNNINTTINSSRDNGSSRVLLEVGSSKILGAAGCWKTEKQLTEQGRIRPLVTRE